MPPSSRSHLMLRNTVSRCRRCTWMSKLQSLDLSAASAKSWDRALWFIPWSWLGPAARRHALVSKRATEHNSRTTSKSLRVGDVARATCEPIYSCLLMLAHSSRYCQTRRTFWSKNHYRQCLPNCTECQRVWLAGLARMTTPSNDFSEISSIGVSQDNDLGVPTGTVC